MIELMLALATAMTSQGSSDELPRAILDAFTANQAAFRAGEVKFRFTRGTASSSAAARAGKFNPGYGAEGRFAFKGELAYHERLFAEADVLSTSKYVGNGQTMVLLSSFRSATDGKRTLMDWIGAKSGKKASHALRLDPGSDRFDADFQFPIALARPDCDWGSPRISLRAAFRGRPGVRIASVDREADFEGRGVVRIAVEYDEGAAEYWIDLERGAIPLKIVRRNIPGGDRPESATTLFHDDVRHVEGAGWLPFEQSWRSDRDGWGGRTVIEEARFSEPPASAFTMEFAEPIGLVDQSRGLTFAKRTSWDVSKLPSPGSRGVGKLPPASFGPEYEAVLPGERESGRGRGLWLIGALTLAAAGLWIWARSRRGEA